MNIYCFSTLSFAKLQFKSVINKAFHKHGVASFTDAWIETPGVVLMRALHVPVALQIPAAAVVAFAISWLIVASIYRLMGKNARYVVG